MMGFFVMSSSLSVGEVWGGAWPGVLCALVFGWCFGFDRGLGFQSFSLFSEILGWIATVILGEFKR